MTTIPKLGEVSMRTARDIDTLNESIIYVEGFGELIRKAREKAGLTQDQLASKLGVKVTLLKKIEREDIRPTLDLARKIEKFLKIKIIDVEQELPSIPKSIGLAKKEEMRIEDFMKKDKRIK